MNFVQSLIDLLKSFWPLDIVQEWERGEYYVCGKHWRSCGKGLKFVVPWFCRIIAIDIVPTIIATPRMDLTLKSGNQISFAASAIVQVTNPAAAINTIDKYKESTQEVLAAVLADRLVRVKEDRLDAESRMDLLRDLAKWVNEETNLFGVEIKKVRFTTFVQNVRAIRLLQDTVVQPW